MSFWGFYIEPDLVYAQVVPESFYIKLASLPATAKDDEKSTLFLIAEKREFPVCTLIGGKIMQQPLDLYIEEGTKIAFKAVGASPISLIGHVAPEDALDGYGDYDSEDEYDDEDLDDEDLDDEDLDGDDDDDDDDDDEEDTDDEDGFIDDEAEEDDDDEEEEDSRLNAFGKRAAPSQVAPGKKPRVIEDDDAAAAKQPNGKKSAAASVPAPAKGKAPEKQAHASAPSTPKQEQPQAAQKQQTPKQAPQQQTPKADAAKNQQKPATPAAPAASTAKSPKTTLAGGLTVTDTVVGTGATATPGKKVHCYYYGKLTKSGKKFDSLLSGKPFEFKLGAGQVIKGWDEGIKGMKVGGKRTIVVPPALGYGSRGAPPDIPPNSFLTFDVELKKVS